MQFWLGVVAGLFTGWMFDYFFGWRPRNGRRSPAPVPPLGTSSEAPSQTSENTPQHDDTPSQESDRESNV